MTALSQRSLPPCDLARHERWPLGEIWGGTLQLVVNLAEMAVAGWSATLLLQQPSWPRMFARRACLARALRGTANSRARF